MTAIIALECEGIPLLVADVLLTVPSRSPKYARDVPSSRHTYLYRRSVDATTISGTLQKIVAFASNRAVVGFAASDADAAIRVVGRLSRRTRGTAYVSLGQINAALRCIDLPPNARVSLLGWFIGTDGAPTCFVWEQSSRTARRVTPPFAIGSGAKDALKEVAAGSVFASAGPGLDTPLVRARAAAICCRTRLMGKQVDTASSITHHDYGGAYQATLWSGTKFEYIDDFTTLFWVHDLENDQTSIRPMAISYRQVGREALYRRLEWKPIEGPFSPHYDHIFRVPSPQGFSWPRAFPAASTVSFGDPLRSALVANAILVRKITKGKGWHLAAVDRNIDGGFVRIGPVGELNGIMQYGIQPSCAFVRLMRTLHSH